ncbi:MAG TPA: glycosyltransferase family 2 protein [Solirubrobacteraceae bacterium]|jgi:GT2 family glycosyltransferase|nr:glycosyltransferase family 2 protein [Solirubrobacteraceae bacterium]
MADPSASIAASLPTPSDGAAPLLSVAVLSYDGRHLLEVILPSLARQRFRDFEVLVVDNGSRDDTVAWLREHWPQVQIVSLAENVGVTAALNVCARSGRGDLVALLNNDLELEPDCLGELVAALREYPQAGWGGAKLRDFEQRDVLDGAGDVFTWAATGGRRGHGERDAGQYDEPRAIFGACGGAALYRRATLAQVGEFDEDFFAFYEDVDWNLRAQLAGFSCRYVPSAVVYHMGSATIGRGLSDFTRYHLWRNTLWIIVKDLPVRSLLRHAPHLLLGQLVNLAVAVRDRKLGIWLRVWRDALRGLPRMLRKRRAVQARRRISMAQLDAVVGPDGGADGR